MLILKASAEDLVRVSGEGGDRFGQSGESQVFQVRETSVVSSAAVSEEREGGTGVKVGMDSGIGDEGEGI